MRWWLVSDLTPIAVCVAIGQTVGLFFCVAASGSRLSATSVTIDRKENVKRTRRDVRKRHSAVASIPVQRIQGRSVQNVLLSSRYGGSLRDETAGTPTMLRPRRGRRRWLCTKAVDREWLADGFRRMSVSAMRSSLWRASFIPQFHSQHNSLWCRKLNVFCSRIKSMC
jgi:hypothetical protein